jgi:hypothetical protein
VSDSAERDVTLPLEEAVIGFDAVARREYVRKVRLHAARGHDRVAHPQLRARVLSELATGPNADSNNDQVCRVATANRVNNHQSRSPSIPTCSIPSH